MEIEGVKRNKDREEPRGKRELQTVRGQIEQWQIKTRETEGAKRNRYREDQSEQREIETWRNR
jgi:hypothetical protein